MSGVLAGFAIVGVIIALGYVLARNGFVDGDAARTLSKIAVLVATPALLFTTLAHADLAVVASLPLLVTAIATLTVAALAALAARIFRWGGRRSIIIVMAASMVNSGNLGIPIATYVLGDASFIAPVILFQQIVLVPGTIIALDISGDRKGGSLLRRIGKAMLNPVLVSALAGVTISYFDIPLPELVYAPFALLGQFAVPAVLLSFGISLHGRGLALRGPDAPPVYTSTVLKVVVHPLLTWAVAHYAFGMSGHLLLAVVVCAALPAAQNVLAYATRYDVGTGVARDSVTLSSILSVPAVFLTVFLLGGA
jgi:malonate transporter